MASFNCAVSTDPVTAINSTDSTKEKSTDDVGFHLPNIPLWTKWALVSIISYVIPLYNTALRVEGEIEDVVEVFAEDVEKVAVLVDKVATKIADVLPEDSIIENDFVMVEYISEEFIKESEKVEQFINKVDDIKEKIENKVEPYIEKWEEDKENKSK
ncbi:hypothetical protein ZOSMA_25G01050 [Zostera marina]|uniref:Uncharacterized protein n=1 Tax=Zostera marina TaxID=29655 RepID=A0A0K9PFK0_ZOSMR|nr:hypothetical protein ZOSMA_25G01050 [Zostera marina]